MSIHLLTLSHMLTGVPERMLVSTGPISAITDTNTCTKGQMQKLSLLAKERMIIDRPQSQTVIGDLTSDPDTILFIFLNAL